MQLPLALPLRSGPLRAAFRDAPPSGRADGLADRRCFHGSGDMECLSLSHLESHPADRRADMDVLSLSRIEDIHTGDSDLNDLSMCR